MRRRLGFTILICLVVELFNFTPIPGLSTDVAIGLLQSPEGLRSASLGKFAFPAYYFGWCIVEWIWGAATEHEKSQHRLAFVAAIAALCSVSANASIFQTEFIVFEVRWLGFLHHVVVQTAGALFVVWLAHLNEAKGIGGGIWAIIALCALTELPGFIRGLLWPPPFPALPILWPTAMALLIAVAMLVVFMELSFTQGDQRGNGAASAVKVPLDQVLLLPVGLATILTYGLSLIWVLAHERRLPQLAQLGLDIYGLGNAFIPVCTLLTACFAFVLNRRRRAAVIGGAPGWVIDLICAIYLAILYAALDTLITYHDLRNVSGDTLLLCVVVFLTARNQIRAHLVSRRGKP